MENKNYSNMFKLCENTLCLIIYVHNKTHLYAEKRKYITKQFYTQIYNDFFPVIFRMTSVIMKFDVFYDKRLFEI